jgi:hypothetical protein
LEATITGLVPASPIIIKTRAGTTSPFERFAQLSGEVLGLNSLLSILGSFRNARIKSFLRGFEWKNFDHCAIATFAL